MTSAHEYLLNLARRNAGILAASPTTAAIAVVGSVARGDVDAYSDIDMTVYHHTMPAVAQIDAWRSELRSTETVWTMGNYDEGDHAECLVIDGVRCDIAHITLESFERTLAEVRSESDPDKTEVMNQKLLSGLLDALPLHGDAYINRWKGIAAQYPDGMAEVMVRKHLKFRTLWIMQIMGVDRGDLLFLYDNLVRSTLNVLGVLAGLNRTYHPGDFKHKDAFFGRLKLAPERLKERVLTALHGAPQAAVDAYAALVRETCGLVEFHMPGLGAADTLTRFEHPGYRIPAEI